MERIVNWQDFLLLLFLLLLTTLWAFSGSSVTLQILGSGGPESGDKRASSGYIVWIDGKSKVLVDFGGGTSLRFEEVGARINDLDVKTRIKIQIHTFCTL